MDAHGIIHYSHDLIDHLPDHVQGTGLSVAYYQLYRGSLEKHSENGHERSVHHLVKEKPMVVNLQLGRTDFDFTNFGVHAELCYDDSDQFKPVGYVSQPPLELKGPMIHEKLNEATFEVRISVLSSKLEHSHFRIKFIATHQSKNYSFFTYSHPIWVISKPNRTNRKPHSDIASTTKSTKPPKLSTTENALLLLQSMEFNNAQQLQKYQHLMQGEDVSSMAVDSTMLPSSLNTTMHSNINSPINTTSTNPHHASVEQSSFFSHTEKQQVEQQQPRKKVKVENTERFEELNSALSDFLECVRAMPREDIAYAVKRTDNQVMDKANLSRLLQMLRPCQCPKLSFQEFGESGEDFGSDFLDIQKLLLADDYFPTSFDAACAASQHANVATTTTTTTTDAALNTDLFLMARQQPC